MCVRVSHDALCPLSRKAVRKCIERLWLVQQDFFKHLSGLQSPHSVLFQYQHMFKGIKVGFVIPSCLLSPLVTPASIMPTQIFFSGGLFSFRSRWLCRFFLCVDPNIRRMIHLLYTCWVASGVCSRCSHGPAVASARPLRLRAHLQGSNGIASAVTSKCLGSSPLGLLLDLFEKRFCT